MGYLSIDYLLYMIPAVVLMAIASWYVRAMYSKWGKVAVSSQVSGLNAAQRLITAGGLQGVAIEGVQGTLTDHYDPKRKVLRLSQGVAQSNSVASVAVAAHELGHAVQDSQGYLPLRFRSALVPLVSIGSNLGWILIAIGLVIGWTDLAWLGVAAFAGGAVFALATLPVELNASRRAKALLAETGIIRTEQEQRGVNSVLRAAALTYVAGLLTAVLQLLYYASLVAGGGRRRS